MILGYSALKTVCNKMSFTRLSTSLARNNSIFRQLRYIGTTSKVKISTSDSKKGGGGAMPEVIGDVKKYENLHNEEVIFRLVAREGAVPSPSSKI